MDVDVVVIGSGAGGLAAAVSLAQAGQKVLVLEQHYVPGGWTHSFVLEGYRFSPGVHYIGELHPGGRMRRIYEGLGVSADVDFCELNPDGFDHVLVAGERFDIPRGRQAFADRLKARFPLEQRGIDGYLDTVSRLCRELDELLEIKGLADAARLAVGSRAVARWGLASARSLVDHFVKDSRLRAILGAQAGDHGLPLNRVSAPIHAAVTHHYFNGGYYPRGGGFTIPRAFVRALKRAGGDIRLSAPVARLLLENRRVMGVRLVDGTEIRSRRVISNADPDVTFRRLVGEDHLSCRLRRKLARTRYSVSALSLFMAVDLDLRALGLDSGNYWYYCHDDIDAIYQQMMARGSEEALELPGMFLTVTTLKDPSKQHGRHHTLEAFTFVDYSRFERWAGVRYGDRPADYLELKERLKTRMLETASRIIPGLRERVVFAELGTPLTNVHYCEATRGSLYGTDKTRWQVGPWAFPIVSELEGLYLCGASTLSHGVMGATLSGLVAAQKILRCRMQDLLTQQGPPLRVYPSEDLAAWPEALRRRIAARLEPAGGEATGHEGLEGAAG